MGIRGCRVDGHCLVGDRTHISVLNRDSTAIQAKLDEIIRVTNAKNLFVGLEELSPDEIAEVRRQVHGHLERRRQVASE